MILPNFLVIGAGKSGTTSIYHALKQHPEIYMSPIKEPNFFALMGEQKTTGYDRDDPAGFHHYPWAVTDWQAYQDLFNDVKAEKAIGESSTMYQYSPLAAQRIKQYLPQVKLIAVFRHPADRLYSRYLHLVREDRPPTPCFEDCLERGNIWWQKNDLIQEGFYYTHMKKYIKLFDRDQLKIMLYEDLRQNPIEFMQEIFDFLDVDSNFLPDMSVQYNVSGKIKSRFINKLIGQNSILKKGMQKIYPTFLEKIKQSSYIRRILVNLRKNNLQKDPICDITRKRLVNEVYREEIIAFQDLINKDISHWLAA